jgi:hypothetical protein
LVLILVATIPRKEGDAARGKDAGMPALKAAVVIMGVMLVVGFAALIAVIAHRLSHPPAPASSVPTASGQSFTATPIELPAGARIEAMSTGSDRVVIDILFPDGARQLLIIDLATGRRLGLIPLQTAP